MLFDKNKQDEFISPIISKNELIGYCYIYNSNIDDYSKYKNSYDLLTYKKIKNSIFIYLNYQSIEDNMKGRNSLHKQYYIINTAFLTGIKVWINFKRINELMTKYNIKEKDEDIKKDIISALKELTDNELNEYKEKIDLKKKYNVEELSPNIIQKNYINFEKLQKQIMIYNDFELIKKDIFEKFNENANKMNNYYLDCFLSEEKIIINYPDNLNSNKFISVIGTLDYSKSFKTEYILIYDSKNDRTKHLNKIRAGLKSYLKGLNLQNNNSEPIIDESQTWKIVGEIVQYDNNNNEISNNTNTFNNNDINKMKMKTSLPKKPNTNLFNNNNNNEAYNNLFGPTPKKEFIRENFRESPKIGLENIDASCYMNIMNATLQCFCI